jgi:Protein of unknown function (DUF3373)
MKKLFLTRLTIMSLMTTMIMSLGGFAQKASADEKTIEARVSELEANQSLNIFKISGSLTNRHDSIGFTNNSSTAFPKDDNQNVNLDRLRFDLNLDADVSERLKFFSTMTASKVWNQLYSQNDTTYNIFPQGRELGGASAYRDTGLLLSKAYFDYSLRSLPLVVSIGRLPTFDGPPTHLPMGRARMGTYPRLAYNASLDGAALSYRMNSLLPENHSLVFQFIYSPLSFTNHAGTGGLANVQPTANNGAQRDASQSPIYAYMMDYNVKSAWWSNLNFIAQYLDSRPVREGDTTLTFFGDGTGPTTGLPTGINYTFPVYSDASFGLNRTTFYLGVEDLFHAGVDLSASYLKTHVDAVGQYRFSNGTPVGSFLLAPGQNSGSFDGSTFLLSARYRLPIQSLRRPFIGGEYQYGSSELLAMDYMAEDLTGFYGNRGTGYHAYYIQPIDDNFSFRVGYTTQHALRVLPTNGVGAFIDCDRQYSALYGTLRLDL